MTATTAAIIFAIFSGVIMVFQACLAAGLPWGAASMGGKYPGKYPPKMRFVAVLNIFIPGFMALIVLSRAEVILPAMRGFSEIAIWVVVVFYFVSTILNTITPSRIERIWAPVAFILLVSGIIVALS